MVILTQRQFEVARWLRPCQGEVVCGDAADACEATGGLWLILADGLGHGPRAMTAAETAVAAVHDAAAGDLPGLFALLQTRLAGTIGAAVSAAWVNPNEGTLVWAGIGNTTLRRFGSAETKLVSRDGVVGQRPVQPRLANLTLARGDLVLLTTDGVTERFGVDDYPGLLGDSPATAARTVVERFGRPLDDAGCLALRYHS